MDTNSVVALSSALFALTAVVAYVYNLVMHTRKDVLHETRFVNDLITDEIDRLYVRISRLENSAPAKKASAPAKKAPAKKAAVKKAAVKKSVAKKAVKR